MEFFKFEDNKVTLARPEIGLYPNIKKIIDRDKGGVYLDDPDGKKKTFAFNEFRYIYFACDYRAYPIQNGLSEKEARKYALVNSCLPKEYKPDILVEELMVQYKKEHLTPAKQTIASLLRLFVINDKLIEKIEQNLTATLSLPTLTKDQIKEVLDYQSKVLEIATSIPKQAENLRAAINLVEEQEKTVLVRRGGEMVKDSMNPDNDIENE